MSSSGAGRSARPFEPDRSAPAADRDRDDGAEDKRDTDKRGQTRHAATAFLDASAPIARFAACCWHVDRPNRRMFPCAYSRICTIS